VLSCKMRDALKRYVADAAALVIFSTTLGAFVEIIISGLSLEQSMKIRLSAVPISLLAGRPYGLYRDRLFRQLNGNRTRWMAAAVDTFASVTFQVPLYLLLLWFAGAKPVQMATAVVSVLALNLVCGRPYGLFLIWCRRCFGVMEAA